MVRCYANVLRHKWRAVGVSPVILVGSRLHWANADCLPKATRNRLAFQTVPLAHSMRFLTKAIPFFLILPLLVASGGCFGYQVGASTLFPPHIRTVYVPVFQADSLRRNLGERLTEAVVKEMELRGLKAATSDTADSILVGKIISMDKTVLGVDENSVPRILETRFRIQASWSDRFGNMLMEYTFNNDTEFVPESGQSIATTQQLAINRLARQIVSRMETRW